MAVIAWSALPGMWASEGSASKMGRALSRVTGRRAESLQGDRLPDSPSRLPWAVQMQEQEQLEWQYSGPHRGWGFEVSLGE